MYSLVIGFSQYKYYTLPHTMLLATPFKRPRIIIIIIPKNWWNKGKNHFIKMSGDVGMYRHAKNSKNKKLSISKLILQSNIA